jgi:hypothetical protein
MEFEGNIKVIYGTKQINDDLKVRKFVVTSLDDKYPQHVTFQLYQDKVTLLDSIKVGQTIVVFFNIKGKEWFDPDGEVKYFNSLDAYRIDFKNNTKKESKEDEEDDYLPF